MPTKNPARAPNAILIAVYASEFSSALAPRKAPKNGPIIIPRGGKKKTPRIKPITEPLTAFFVPPNFRTK